MPISHYINGHPIYVDGPLRLDLTPPDLLANGFVIREARTDGKFCWWQRHDAQRSPGVYGESFGPERDNVDDAIADARWLLTADCWRKQGQLSLLEVAA